MERGAAAPLQPLLFFFLFFAFLISTASRLTSECTVEQTVWLRFLLRIFLPFCGYIIFVRETAGRDSRQAGGDSSIFLYEQSSFSAAPWLVELFKPKTISAQSILVSRRRESIISAGITPQGFLSQHSLSIMSRNFEVFKFSSIASQRHVL